MLAHCCLDVRSGVTLTCLALLTATSIPSRGEGQKGELASPRGEDWSQESPEAMAKFLEIKRYRKELCEIEMRGEKLPPAEAVRQYFRDAWRQFVEDYPDSRLCVHAYSRLGNWWSMWRDPNKPTDYVKASEYFRKAFELYPDLLCMETITSRTCYASSSLNAHERASRRIELYRWLRVTAPELLRKSELKINGFGRYVPQVPDIYGNTPSRIRGKDPAVAAVNFISRILDSALDRTERNLVSAADRASPEIGWMVLEELGDLLPEAAQLKIIEVAGGEEGARRPELTPDGLVAKRHFEATETVLSSEMADRLGNPDVFLPPTERLTGPAVYRAMADSSRWIRRVLQKRWWPKPDRPKGYLPAVSPRGYDAIYRHWAAEGTSFLAQSAYAWLEISLRRNMPATDDPRLDRAQVERRLRQAVQVYIADAHGVLKNAAFDIRSAPYGYDARLRMTPKLTRKLAEPDREHALDWARGMRVQTNGTSFLFRFELKTDPDGRIRHDRRRWFTGSVEPRAPK